MDKLDQLKSREVEARADYITARANMKHARKLYRLAKALRKRQARLYRLDAKRNRATSKLDITTEAIRELEAEAKGRKHIKVTEGRL